MPRTSPAHDYLIPWYERSPTPEPEPSDDDADRIPTAPYRLDEGITIQVQDRTYRVEKALLTQHSTFFAEMFSSSHLGGNDEGRTLENPIVLGAIESKDMDVFLRVLTTPWFVDMRLKWEEWCAALRLATMWRFKSLHRSILKEMREPLIDMRSVELCLVGRQCGVSGWLLIGLIKLIMRPKQVSTSEGEKLGMSTVMAVCRLREWRVENSFNSRVCVICREKVVKITKRGELAHAESLFGCCSGCIRSLKELEELINEEEVLKCALDDTEEVGRGFEPEESDPV